ncbi:exopolygalacturonase-like [Prunus yedoensis var. nudiflora]|uniref:Exopolygalacturonase-like n=1 Tax=Prunus yedoensis var. nudiflora TaxID=2094558 RepID=A0A314V0I0_PRUYE|nr:exopolygalacturonase-like [Prunus yedoensis var. nudiflora]
MGIIISSLGRVFLLLFLLVWVTEGLTQPKFFNVMDYGAVGGGKTDNSQAFLKAWSDACQWNGKSGVVVPQGTFKLYPVIFSGPCNGPIAFVIRGTLKATTDPSSFSAHSWINFRYVDELKVSGGGTLDGQGASAWHLNNCKSNPQCQALPISMSFDFVTNAIVQYIKSYDSKNAHFKVFGCHNMDFRKIRISAPADSPNTDGIKIGSSYRIRIAHSRIATGDDCVAIVEGSKKIHVSKVFCGPGHGISIGSLGGYANEDDVVGVVVKNCTFLGTSNGVRIKTWASPYASKASNFTFQDIFMDDVLNPITIDQEYCPHPPCSQQTSSSVQISDITYKNIWGRSSSEIAVSLVCSKSRPCKNVVLENINLAHSNPPGRSSSVCFHAKGASHGSQTPPPCL